MAPVRCAAIVAIITVTWLSNSPIRASDDNSTKTIIITTQDHIIFGNMSTEERLHSKMYDRTIRPFYLSGKPCKVQLQLFLTHLGPVNQLEMRYTMDIFLRQRWTDPRLADPKRETVALNQDTIDLLWVPGLYALNEMDGTIHTITTPNRMLYVKPDGFITYSQRLTLSLMCRMNLVNFPLDNQTCHIQFESYSDTIDKLVFTWADEPIQFNTEKGLNLAEFVFLNTETGVCAKNYSTGNYSCIIGKFRFKRKVTYYLMQTYLPTGLFVSLSWISFWIDEAHIGARVTLGMLTVLTTTSQGNLVSKNLPRLSYIKAIDVWMSTCLIFVFAGVLEFCVVLVVQRQMVLFEMKRKIRMDQLDTIRKMSESTPLPGTLPETIPPAKSMIEKNAPRRLTLVKIHEDDASENLSCTLPTVPAAYQPSAGDTDTVQDATMADEYKDKRSSRRVSAFLLPELAATHGRSSLSTSIKRTSLSTSNRRTSLSTSNRRTSLSTTNRRTSLAAAPMPVYAGWAQVRCSYNQLEAPDIPSKCGYCFRLSRRHRSSTIDNISKIAFPLSFAIFNVAYWCYYYA